MGRIKEPGQNKKLKDKQMYKNGRYGLKQRKSPYLLPTIKHKISGNKVTHKNKNPRK